MTKILLLLDCPSAIDYKSHKILADSAGREFIKRLHAVGIAFHEIETRYICKHHIPEPRLTTKRKLRFYSKYTPKNQVLKPEVEKYIPALKEEIGILQPTVIIGCGELALNILTGEQSLSKWRGSVLATSPEWFGTKFIPTYTPADVQRMFEWSWIQQADLKRAVFESEFEMIKAPNWDFTVRPTFVTVVSRLERLLEMAAIAPDMARNGRTARIGSDGWLNIKPPQNGSNQSTSISPTVTRNNKYLLSTDVETRQGYISCVGIGWSETEALCIPFLCIDQIHYWNEYEEIEIVKLLYRLFTHENIEWALQNGVYDFQYFAAQWGFVPKYWCDTMIQHHTVWSALKKSLDFQSSLKLEYHRFWKDEGKEFHTSIKTTWQETQYWEYNCKDCISTFQLALYNYIELEKYNQVDQYLFQMKQNKAAFRMMLRGVKANESRKKELALDLLNAIGQRQQRLEYIIGQPINISSPKQMTTFFYETLGQRVILNRKSENPTAADEALDLIGLREPLLREVCKIIQELRSLNVFLSTFVKAPLSEDKRFRSSYSIPGTTTFRWSSSKDAFGSGLNLQNIPKGTEE